MDSDEDLDVDGEGEGKESESGQTTASLTGFLFGNIDKEGKLEDTYLDEVFPFREFHILQSFMGLVHKQPQICTFRQLVENPYRSSVKCQYFFLIEKENGKERKKYLYHFSSVF